MDIHQLMKYAAVFAAGAYTQSDQAKKRINDPEFQKQFDAALKVTSQQEIDQLIHLKPDELVDWVIAPEQFRSQLLNKFINEKEHDENVISKHNQRHLTILKIFLPIALLGLLIGGVVASIYNPVDCTKETELREYLSAKPRICDGNPWWCSGSSDELRAQEEKEIQKHPTRHDDINSGGWICGEKINSPDTTIFKYGINLVFLSIFVLFGIVFYRYMIPEPRNVFKAKIRRRM